MAESAYKITASVAGISNVVGGLRQIQTEVKKTSKVVLDSGKADRQAQMEARRREREATREYQQALREKARAERRMHQESRRLRQEDLANQRAYLSSLHKQEQDLRDTRNRAIRSTAAGGAGLVATGKGLQVAAGFESSMTEMRLAVERLGKDGAVDVALLNSQMDRLERVAVRLGNKLPGSTRDMVESIVALKQTGLGVESILGGAGEAAAYLAVITKNVPKDLAKGYGQLGQAFQLKPEEYVPSADFFAKLYRVAGVDPLSLIEGAKFFAPRAGLPLGLTGMKGLKSSGELLGALKRAGLEEGIGGRELGMLMSRLTMDKLPQQKMLASLRSKGIDLEFFGKKGEFLGVENLVTQLQKLNKLSQEDRLTALSRLFTEESKGAAEILIKLGNTGLKAFRDDLEAVPPLQHQINELQKDFAQKWESLQGTTENVVARTFTPLLDTLKPVVDLTNEAMSSLEGFAKTNPEVAKVATSILGIGSAVLVAHGGFKLLTTSVGLYRVAARLTAGETALQASLRSTGAAATATSASVGAATTRVAGYKRALNTRIPAVVGTTIVLTLATEVLATIMKYRAEADAAWEEAKAAASGEKQANERLLGVPTPEGIKPGEWVDRINKNQRSGMPGMINEFLKNRFAGFSGSSVVDLWNTYMLGKGELANPKSVQGQMREHLPQLETSSVFGQFMRSLAASKDIQPETKQILRNAAIAEFAQSFAAYSEAMKRAKGDEAEAIRLLIQADQEAARKTEQSSNAAADGLNRVGEAAENLAGRLNSVAPPPVLGQTRYGGFGNPSIARPVLSPVGLAPASGSRDFYYSPNIAIHGAGKDQKAEFARILEAHKNDIRGIIDEQYRRHKLTA